MPGSVRAPLPSFARRCKFRPRDDPAAGCSAPADAAPRHAPAWALPGMGRFRATSSQTPRPEINAPFHAARTPARALPLPRPIRGDECRLGTAWDEILAECLPVLAVKQCWAWSAPGVLRASECD